MKTTTSPPNNFTKLKWPLFIVLLVGGLVYTAGCLYTTRVEPSEAVQIALEWNQLMLDAEVYTEGYRGPVAARAYGYVGLAAYEAALPGLPRDFQSMSHMYPLLKLPQAPAHEEYQLSIALNAAYSSILSYFFLSTPATIKTKQEKLRKKWDDVLMKEVDSTTVRNSIHFGEAVSRAIYEWSATDSVGNRANLHNYDKNYKAPVGEGKWVTSVYFPMPPLLPKWGNVRPFVINTEDFIAKPLPPYSVQPNELYHAQAVEVLSLSKPLSAENQWIAEFWNDDRPGLTFSPAGHWLAITNQVISKERPSIEKTLETYLKIGFALSDVMVATWKAKYLYNLERPETFIQKNLAKEWRPYSPSPPFPTYPSGHSMMGAAASVILTHFYGDQYEMTDHSHKGLRDFVTEPRKFKSFDEMAKENALSRIFLGVHFRMDCEEGLRLGDLIGKEMVNLELEKKLTQ